jgi:hypothetical protein
VYTGAGHIAERGFNKLRVVGAQGPELILKYHWIPGLVASPAATVEAVKVAPGFPPLIRVVRPSGDFTLSYCAGCKPK